MEFSNDNKLLSKDPAHGHKVLILIEKRHPEGGKTYDVLYSPYKAKTVLVQKTTREKATPPKKKEKRKKHKQTKKHAKTV